jgi:hypothetical protein
MIAELLELRSSAEKNFAVLEPRSRVIPWQPGKPSLDIVIPVCCDDVIVVEGEQLPFGLGMTLASIQRELKDSGLNYRVIVVDNGNGNDAHDPLRTALDNCYRRYPENLTVIREPDALTPPGARNLGASAGSGDIIFFFDSHVLLRAGFFQKSIDVFEKFFADSVRGATYHDMFLDGIRLHHSRTGVSQPLPEFLCWLQMNHVNSQAASVWRDKPIYRCLTSGHGAFSIRRDAWNEVGGYWKGFIGFGAEEPELDGKLAMMGFSTWMAPGLGHWHNMNSGGWYKEGYRETREQVAMNQISVCHILGFSEEDHLMFYKNIESGKFSDLQRYWLQREALSRSDEQAKWLARKRKWTLHEVIEKFEKAGVAV